MGLMPGRWPPCHSAHVSKGGQTTAGPPRSPGPNPACPPDSFPRALLSPGRAPALQEPSVDRRRYGRGRRETARVGQMRTPPVLHALNKKRWRSPRGPDSGSTRCRLRRWTG